MSRRVALLLAPSLLFACAAIIDPSRVPSLSDDALCAGYHQAREFGSAELVNAYATEIKTRNLISEREWGIVYSNRVAMGISKCALYASWGYPTRENRSVGSWGIHTQHVYGSRQYVYTKNGSVTSWQQ